MGTRESTICKMFSILKVGHMMTTMEKQDSVSGFITFIAFILFLKGTHGQKSKIIVTINYTVYHS